MIKTLFVLVIVWEPVFGIAINLSYKFLCCKYQKVGSSFGRW